jgi:hypothetical protein
MKTIIHVNQHIIKANRKNGTCDPPLTVKTYKETSNAHTVFINGPVKVVYRPNAPLACGAHVWIETEAPVTVTNTTTWPTSEGRA